MFRPSENGTKYSHYKQAEESGATVPELESPPFPKESEYIWQLWIAVHNERDDSFSVQCLKVRDIMAWAAAYNFRPTPFEIDCIQEIDKEYIAVHGPSKP